MQRQLGIGIGSDVLHRKVIGDERPRETAERQRDEQKLSSRGRAREAIDYFLWAFTPLRPMTARDIYELVSTNAFTTRGLYLNLGYWKNARTIDEACQALAELVGSTAAMGPGDDIVDVGFGFAAQDVFWMEHFAPRQIIGLNVTPFAGAHRARARSRAWHGGSY